MNHISLIVLGASGFSFSLSLLFVLFMIYNLYLCFLGEVVSFRYLFDLSFRLEFGSSYLGSFHNVRPNLRMIVQHALYA